MGRPCAVTYAWTFLSNKMRWQKGRNTDPGHATIDQEICSIDEAALVTGKEKHSLSLLNGFSETTGREVDFPSVSFCCIVSKPILKKGCATEQDVRQMPSNAAERLTSVALGTEH